MLKKIYPGSRFDNIFVHYACLEQMECEDLHVILPCDLAARVKIYATENHTSLTHVVIEALDTFLREQRMVNL
jgi:hypothetical protein